MALPFLLPTVLLLTLLLGFPTNTLASSSSTSFAFVGNKIETADLGFTSGGYWTREKNCERGAFITGYALFIGQKGQVVALQAQCSYLDAERTVEVKSMLTIVTPGRENEAVQSFSFANSSTYAIGFSMQTWLDPRGGGRPAIGGWQFNFHDEDNIAPAFPVNSIRKRVEEYLCAEDYGICGIQAKIKSGNSTNPGHITRFKFRCCYYCTPREREEVVWGFLNHATTAVPLSYRQTTGRQFSSEMHQSHKNSVTQDASTDRSNSVSLISSTNTNHVKSSSISGNRQTGASRGTSRTSTVGSQHESNENSQGATNSRVSGGTSFRNRELRLTGKSSTFGRGTSWDSSVSRGASESQTDSGSSNYGTEYISSQTNGQSSSDSENGGISASVNIPRTPVSVGGSYSGGWGNGKQSSTSSSQSTSHSSTRGTSFTRGLSMDVSRRFGQQRHDEAGKEGKDEVEYFFERQWNTDNELSQSKSKVSSSTKSMEQVLSQQSQFSFQLERSQESSRESSVQKSIQKGAEEAFHAHMATTRSSIIDWTQMDSTIWTDTQEEDIQTQCAPRSNCTLVQVVGQCGEVTVRTRKIINYWNPIAEQAGRPTSSPPPLQTDPLGVYNISRSGEVWIVARNISFWAPSRKWEPFMACPAGSVVQGHQQSSVDYKGFQLINGYRLTCSDISDGTFLYKPGQLQSPVTIARANWTSSASHGDGQWARGYRFVRAVINGRNYTGNHELVYAGVNPKPLPKTGFHTVEEVLCPHMHAVCGLSTMLDSYGSRLVTNVALKCCFHCQPQEHFVNKLILDNESPTDVRHSVRVAIGRRNGTTRMEKDSTGTDIQMDVPSIRAGFSTTLGHSKNSGFDWTHTDNSIWEQEETRTLEFPCPAHHHCSYKQLIGHCGPFQFPTNHYKIAAVPNLPPVLSLMDKNTIKLLTHRSVLEEIEGSIFISLDLAPGHSRKWEYEPMKLCNIGSIVTNVHARAEDGLGLTGLRLQCSRMQGYTKGVDELMYIAESTLTAEGSDLGDWDASGSQAGEGMRPVTGFYFHWTENENMENPQLFYGPLYDRKRKSFRVYETCPVNYQVCGVYYRLDEHEEMIADLKFKCCIHCMPEEAWITRRQDQNDLGFTTTWPVEYEWGVEGHDHTKVVTAQLGKKIDKLQDLPTLKALFTMRFPRGSPKGFKWTLVPASFWTSIRNSTVNYPCSAHSVCHFQQLTGICGPIQIPTNYYRVRKTPAPPDGL